MKRAYRPRRFVRDVEAEVPWWAPVGLWQSWLGVTFLALAALLSHWS